MIAYGTYQRFEYQTANLEPTKQFAVAMLKLLAVLAVFIAALVVAVAVFQLVVIASNFVVGWLAVHGWQVGLTIAIFAIAWRVKP